MRKVKFTLFSFFRKMKMQNLEHTIAKEKFTYLLKNVEGKYATEDLIRKGLAMGLTYSEIEYIWDNISNDLIASTSRINKKQIISALEIHHKKFNNNPHNKDCKDIRQRLRKKLESRK